jgi:hypothetical protein
MPVCCHVRSVCASRSARSRLLGVRDQGPCLAVRQFCGPGCARFLHRAEDATLPSVADVASRPWSRGSKTHCSGWALDASPCSLSLAVFCPRLLVSLWAAFHGLGSCQIPPLRSAATTAVTGAITLLNIHMAELPVQNSAGPGCRRIPQMASAALPSASPRRWLLGDLALLLVWRATPWLVLVMCGGPCGRCRQVRCGLGLVRGMGASRSRRAPVRGVRRRAAMRAGRSCAGSR